MTLFEYTQRPNPTGSIGSPAVGSIESRSARRYSDQRPLEHEDRDVSLTGGVSTRQGEDGLHPDLAPGEMVAAELDAHGVGADVVAQHFAAFPALRDAVVGGEDLVLFDKCARARDVARHARER